MEVSGGEGGAGRGREMRILLVCLILTLLGCKEEPQLESQLWQQFGNRLEGFRTLDEFEAAYCDKTLPPDIFSKRLGKTALAVVGLQSAITTIRKGCPP